MIKLRHVVSCSVMSIFVVRQSVRSSFGSVRTVSLSFLLLSLLFFLSSHLLPYSFCPLYIFLFFSFHLFLCPSRLNLLLFSSSHYIPSSSIPSPAPPSITILSWCAFLKPFYFYFILFYILSFRFCFKIVFYFYVSHFCFTVFFFFLFFFRHRYLYFAIMNFITNINAFT
jgi:hypothetical protein